MKNILIYGASGHSKMIIDIIYKNKNYTIIGFVDSYKPRNEIIGGYKILGNLTELPELIKEYDIEGIIIGIGDNYTRQNIYVKIKEIAPQLEFVKIIHPSAIIAYDVEIGEGTVIMANVIINANAKVGSHCILNTASSLGHDSSMKNFSSLASRVTIAGNVQIGTCSAICLSATIIQNITIGDKTVIGAGSLVLKSIGDLKQAIGAPINCIKPRSEDSKYLSSNNNI